MHSTHQTDLLEKYVQSRWFVQHTIHSGQYESTYQAVDTHEKRIVLLRVLSTEDTRLHSRFLQEAFILNLLSHPNVISIQESGYCRTHGVHFITLDHPPGCTLEDAMCIPTPRPFRMMYAHILDILQGLEAIHAHGIIHRSLTPQNIHLDTQQRCARIGGFRVSKITNQSAFRLTLENEVCGAPYHIAPEQITRDPLTPRTDLYAFGVLLFEILTGRLPYPSDSLGTLFRDHLHAPIPNLRDHWALDVPYEPKLGDLLHKLLAKLPEYRPSSAQEVHDRLYDIAQDRPDLINHSLRSPKIARMQPLPPLHFAPPVSPRSPSQG